jgi:hypothetical protein
MHRHIAFFLGCVFFLTTKGSWADVGNVAPVFGTASQSTTGFGLPAGNAIDGNPGTISHTDTGDLMPFFEVDLGEPFSIEALNLITRSGCCAPPERDYNLTLEIFDDMGAVAFTNGVINPWDGIGAAAEVGDGAAFNIDLSGEPGGGIDGQRVRVSKVSFAGTEWLSIAELEIFADAEFPGLPPELDPNVNVALNKPTTGDVAFGFPTENGNDGITGGQNFTHADNTNPPPDNPFWQVDLQGEFELTRIEIVDRGDGCCDPNRLEGSIISVLAADGTTVLFESDPIAGLTVPSSGETVGYDFSTPLSGAAHVRVDGFNQYFQFSDLRAYQVPEPSSVTLFFVGLIGWLAGRNRRRNDR